MSSAVYALIGVMVGTLATLIPQIWDRVLNSRSQKVATVSAGVADLLDATWGRLILNAKGRKIDDGARAEAFTGWVLARNRFAALPIERTLLMISWVELELMAADHGPDLSWHNAELIQSRIAENVTRLSGGDVSMLRRMIERRDALQAQFLPHRYAADHAGSVTAAGD